MKIMDSRIESAIVTLYSGLVVKLPSKYLCLPLENCGVLSFGQGRFFLQWTTGNAKGRKAFKLLRIRDQIPNTK